MVIVTDPFFINSQNPMQKQLNLIADMKNGIWYLYIDPKHTELKNSAHCHTQQVEVKPDFHQFK